MLFDLTYNDAIAKAEHLKALGATDIYLRDDTDFPYSKVESVEEGGSWRLNMPTGCYLLAEFDGLTFKLSVDFESYSENGTGTSNFDRSGLRDLMLKLPPKAQASLAALLEAEALPALSDRRKELEAALQRQADSEDCVRGVIAMAGKKEAA